MLMRSPGALCVFLAPAGGQHARPVYSNGAGTQKAQQSITGARLPFHRLPIGFHHSYLPDGSAAEQPAEHPTSQPAGRLDRQTALSRRRPNGCRRQTA